MLPGPPRGAPLRWRLGRREAPVLANALDDSHGVAEAIEIEEVGRSILALCLGCLSEISPAHGDGCVRTIRQADDDVGIGATSDANDLNLLTAERVVGMGDGHQSRSGIGRRGSVL